METYLVGGAVRDTLIGKVSKDLDILVTGIDMDDLQYMSEKAHDFSRGSMSIRNVR